MHLALSDSQSLIIQVSVIPGLFVGLMFLGRWLKRNQKVPLGIPYTIFSLAVAIQVPLFAFGMGHAWNGYIPPSADTHLRAVIAVSGALSFIAVLERYFWGTWFENRMHGPAPKFLIQISAIIIFLLVTYLVANIGYGISLAGLALSSGIAVGVIGFAAQDLLSNILAGIALQIGKPFKIGDWLIVEVAGGDKHVEVLELNWRSTRLRDNDDILYDIPNKAIVNSTIRNLTHPKKKHGIRLRVRFEYHVPPNFVKDVLRRATSAGIGVMKEPGPKVFLRDFGDSGLIYEIRFFMEEEARFNDIMDSIRTNVWYESRRAGLTIPFPTQNLQVMRAGRGGMELHPALPDAAKVVPVLKLLEPHQFEDLLNRTRWQRFGKGEKIIEQGTKGSSMFLFLSGEADVLVRNGDSDQHVASLKTGDCAGEMSLLTGEPRSATVRAKVDCDLLEIRKEDLQPILQENQNLVDRLGELLAERKMQNEDFLNMSAPKMEERKTEYKQNFLNKLYSFFDL